MLPPVAHIAVAGVAGRRVSHTGAVSTRPAGAQSVHADFALGGLFGHVAWRTPVHRGNSSIKRRQVMPGKLSDRSYSTCKKQVSPSILYIIAPEHHPLLSTVSCCFVATGYTDDTEYGYPIEVKSLTLVQHLEIPAWTPAEFKGAAKTPTVPAVIHYSLSLTHCKTGLRLAATWRMLGMYVWSHQTQM